MKKSIYFKIWKFPKLSETFIVDQVVLAIQLGFKVKVLVTDFEEHERINFSDLFSLYNLNDLVVIQDYNIPKSKILRLFKAGYLLLWNIKILPHIFRFYKEQEKPNLEHIYEVIFFRNFREVDNWHVQYGTNKSPLDKLKKIDFIKGKLIVSFHGHDLFFPINGRIRNKDYYNDLFKYSDFLIPNTRFLEHKLLALGAREYNIKTLPVSVDTSFFKATPRKKRTTTYLLTVGRLDSLKGQSYGIESVKYLLKKGYSVNYYIAGAGNNLVFLKQKVRKLGLENEVQFVGALEPKEVVKLMQDSDIFLMTSVTNSIGVSESQGLVTAEAQACGLPVVAFDSGGVQYTIEDGKSGFLVPEKDFKRMAERIEFLINNESFRLGMSEYAITFAEKGFSRNKIRSEWDKIYNF